MAMNFKLKYIRDTYDVAFVRSWYPNGSPRIRLIQNNFEVFAEISLEGEKKAPDHHMWLNDRGYCKKIWLELRRQGFFKRKPDGLARFTDHFYMHLNQGDAPHGQI
jgi:hypothetical protein